MAAPDITSLAAAVAETVRGLLDSAVKRLLR